MKRVACIYFPDWCLQHRLLARPADERRPLVVASTGTGRGERVRACCRRAETVGVRRGMPVAEARALLDDANGRIERAGEEMLDVVREDLREDRAALRVEAQRAWNFSPLVSVAVGAGSTSRQDPRACEESILVNVTGCGHLFVDERGLAVAMHEAWSVRGYRVRVAVAASAGVAWAVSHAAEWTSQPMSPLVVSPGRDVDWMRRLPIEALALEPSVVELLKELDLTTIDGVLGLPRAELKRRFGRETLWRIDRALGRRDEPLDCLPMPDPVRASWRFESPINRRDWLEQIQRELIEEVAAGLRQRGRATMQLVCRVTGEGASGKGPIEWETRLVEPTSQASHLLSLVRLQMERRRWPRDVSTIEVFARGTMVPRRSQSKLFEADQGIADDVCGCEMARLVERLGSRLGHAAVVRPVLVEATIPEAVVRMEEVASGSQASRECTPSTGNESDINREWPARWGPASRPLWLEKTPGRIEATVLGPEGPPVGFLWRRQSHRVAWSWGPERIETGWWEVESVARDYYRVETTEGERFWLFRRRGSDEWFLHGVFE